MKSFLLRGIPLLIFLFGGVPMLIAQNNTCATATAISTGTTTAPNITGGGGAVGSGTNAHWYSYTPTGNGTIDVHSCGATPDTRLHIYDGCGNASVADDDDDCSSGNQAEVLGLSVNGGTTYYIEWTDRWSGTGFDFTVAFTAAPACLAPTAQTATNLTTTSADLGWTENGTATAWDIEWGATGFTQGMGTTVAASSNPYTLGSLTANTSYDFYVRADCGGAGTSTWAGPYTFTTACNANTTYPFTEGFENGGAMPACWSQEYVSASVDWTFTGANQNSSVTARTGSYLARFYTTNTSANTTKLVSPPLDLTSLTTPRLKFYYSQAPWGSDQDELKIYYKISSAGAWTQLAHYTASVTSWTEVILTLPSSSADYYIAFEGIGDYGRGVTIDDVTVEETPSCLAPSALTATNITTTSADLGWTENGTATAWDIEWGATGFTQGMGMNIAASSNPYTLGSLTANTSYDYYVRANCGGAGTSTWAGPYTFTTACNAITTFPWTDDLESGSSTLSCWSVNNNNGDADAWVIQTSATYANSGSQSYQIYTDFNGGSNDDYLISPQLTLTGGERLKFNYRVRSSGEPNDFTVLLSTTGTAPADFSNTILPNASYSNTTYQEAIIDLSAYTGNVYIAFHVPPNGLDGWYLYIDDITVEAIPACVAPTALTATNVTATSADLGWTENGTATVWNIEWGATGFTQGMGTPITGTTTNPHALSGLTEQTSYDFYVQADCGSGQLSTWAGPFTFTTTCAALTLPQLEDFSAGFTPTICWDEATSGTPATGPSGFGSGNWAQDGFGNNGTSGAAKINLFSNNVEDWILTPDYVLSGATNYVVEFDFGVFNWNGTTASTLGSDDQIQLLVSTNSGASWINLATFDNTYVTAAAGNQESVDITVYANSTVQFAIWATDGSTNDLEDNDIFVDNFRVRGVFPNDVGVTAITAGNCTNTEAVTVDITNFGTRIQVVLQQLQ